MEIAQSLRTPVKILLLTPIVLLLLGIYHGFMQTLYRAGIIRAESFLGLEYYQGLTAHGVINAVVLTTFFAVAFGHVVISDRLQKPLAMPLVWGSILLMGIGTLMASVTILLGEASVLYTFYPPLKASWVFYLGLAVFVVGSWLPLWAWVSVYVLWRKENPDKKTPLAVVGMMTTFIIWQLCTLPVAYEVLLMLLPWSLGWVDHINVVLARTLFWFFGHPLVYFWLLPTYTIYYTILPAQAGGKLYSDFAARFVFMAFLVLSSPLGLHHQFADPGISSDYKALHTVLTSFVAIPSLMTAFTLAASLEIAARMRGGEGLFGWWKKLPYFDEKAWFFPYMFCGLIIFIFGGATGIVNASFNVNQVVHNTSWVPAHFHFTVGGPVFLAILGMSLYLLAKAFQTKIPSLKAAMWVPYLWMIGVMTMSTGMFINGLNGAPRRTNMGMSYLNPDNPGFQPEWVIPAMIAVLGAVIMVIAMVKFFYLVARIVFSDAKEAQPSLEFAEPLHDEDITLVKNFRPWVIAAIIAILIAYIPPLKEILENDEIASGAFTPDSPVKVTPK